MKEDRLSAEAISHNLATRFIGRRVLCYPRLASTMDVARREAGLGAAEGTVVVAEEQTAGRGRMKRVWVSPKGSVALSVLLYPAVAHLPYLIMIASLAVVHSIEAVTGLKPVIKWPNDVVISGRKVCGILVESKVRGDTVDYAIIGIGVNVNLRLADFPELPLATSLSQELGKEVSRLAVMRQLLVALEELYLSLPGTVYEQWRDRLITLGGKVTVTWGEARYEGVAESVAQDGSLLLRHANGSLTRMVAGDAAPSS